MTTEIKNPVLRLLVYGHVWLALGAAAQVWCMCHLLRTDPGLPMLFAATATFSAYGWMRLIRMNVSELQGSEHMAWFRAQRTALLWAIVINAAIAATALYLLLPGIHPAFWIASASAALYVLPGPRKTQEVWGLRRIPLLKSFVIAFAWAAMTVCIALAGDDAYVRTQAVQLFTLQFCFFLAIAIVFDIRDASYDLASIRSVPQLIGARWTRVLAVLLMLLPIWMLTAVVLVENALPEDYVTDVPIRWSSIFTLTGYIISAVFLGMRSPDRPLFHGLVLDGLLILVPLLAWLGDLL